MMASPLGTHGSEALGLPGATSGRSRCLSPAATGLEWARPGTRVFESRSVDETVRILERRVELQEQQIEALQVSLKQIAETLLANPVIEDVELHLPKD